MKKELSILSLMAAFVFSLFLISCGTKRDEALVTEYNNKKSEADKMLKMLDDNNKQMSTDHSDWKSKLDDAAKKPGADTAKINAFRAQIQKEADMAKANPVGDSLRAAENAKTETNDQLKAAIAGLDAQISACNNSCNMMMDAHKKLGADIVAFLAANEPADQKAGKEEKKAGHKAATKEMPGAPNMDMSKHPVKPQVGGTPRKPKQ